MEENTIEKYIKNNILDIEQLIKDYKTYIYTIAKNNSKGFLKNEDIEEIVSDTFLTIWHNKNKIEKNKMLKNYISAVTKNLVLKKFREKQSSNLNISLNDENLSSEYNDIEYVYENSLIEKTINEELKNFTKLEYQIFTKYYYFSKSIKEIASEMNISESLVKVKLHRVRKKLKERLKSKGIIPKNLVIVFAILLIAISSFVIAKEIIKHFFLDSSDGVENALNNGYIESYEMKENNYSNGISIEVESVLMDDYNLAIVFCLKFDNIEYVKNADYCNFDNLLIMDENNNLIVTKFEGKIKDSKLLNFFDINNNYPGISNGNESVHIKSKDDDEIVLTYITNSSEFPKSHKLKIITDEISLHYSEDNFGEKIDTINGDWNIEVDLPEEFYNRRTEVYTLESSNDKNLELLEANLSQTGIRIEFKTKWGQQYYNEDDSDEIIYEKLEKIRNEYLTFEYIVENGITPLYNYYIVNSFGEKFYPANSSDGDGGMSVGSNAELNYFQIFNMTPSDATDKIIIIMEKDSHYFDTTENKYLEIVLSRKSN